MPRASAPHASTSTLVLVVIVAVSVIALRFWRIGWGLDEGAWFPDESLWSVRARAFVPFSWTSLMEAARGRGNLPYLVYPTLYGYLVGAAGWVADKLGLVATWEPSFTLGAILLARCISALAGVASVAIVGLLGARMYSPGVGLAAAALLAVVPLEAMQVRYAAVDALLTTCATLALLASFALMERGSVTAAAFAGGAVGLAFATKYTGLAAAAPVAWALLERAWRERAVVPVLGLAATVVGGFAAVVLVACPPCVLHAERMLDAMAWLRGVLMQRAVPPNAHIVPTLGWYAHPYLYQVVAVFPYALGWPVHALALLGVGAALWRRAPRDRLLLAAIVPCFLAVASSRVTEARYLLPLFPPLLVLAARAVLGPAGNRRPGAVLLAAAWAYALVLTTSQIARFSYDQQKAVARWIAAQPAGQGASVAVPRYLAGFSRLPDFLMRAGLRVLPVQEPHWFDGAPDFFVLPGWYEIAIRRDAPDGSEAALLRRLQSGAAGYHQVARWEPTWFLQRDFYTHLDPGFGAHLWQGGYGFTVYARDTEHDRRS